MKIQDLLEGTTYADALPKIRASVLAAAQEKYKDKDNLDGEIIYDEILELLDVAAKKYGMTNRYTLDDGDAWFIIRDVIKKYTPQDLEKISP